MDLSKFPVFRMMSGKMRWLASRQGVLSQNVANADTPKYEAKDLKEVDFSKTDGATTFRVELARTNPAHFARTGEKSDFDLYSLGSDGQEGGEGEAKDVGLPQ